MAALPKCDMRPISVGMVDRKLLSPRSRICSSGSEPIWNGMVPESSFSEKSNSINLVNWLIVGGRVPVRLLSLSCSFSSRFHEQRRDCEIGMHHEKAARWRFDLPSHARRNNSLGREPVNLLLLRSRSCKRNNRPISLGIEPSKRFSCAVRDAANIIESRS